MDVFQIVPEVENNDSTEHLSDSSMALEALTAPIDVNSNRIEHRNSDTVDNLNTNSVLQMDGQVDSNPDSIVSLDEYAERPPKDRSMPLLDAPDSEWDFVSVLPEHKNEQVELEKVKQKLPELVVKLKRMDIAKLLKKAPKTRKTRVYNRRSPEEKLEEKLRLMRYRIDKLNKKRELEKMEIISKKKKYTSICLLEKGIKPKFRISPGGKWLLAKLLKTAKVYPSLPNDHHLDVDGSQVSRTNEKETPKKKRKE